MDIGTLQNYFHSNCRGKKIKRLHLDFLNDTFKIAPLCLTGLHRFIPASLQSQPRPFYPKKRFVPRISFPEYSIPDSIPSRCSNGLSFNLTYCGR